MDAHSTQPCRSRLLRNESGRACSLIAFRHNRIPDASWIRAEKLAFWNRGDGSFLSGVYSRAGFDASAGLGLEALVSTPSDADAWQEVWLALNASLDSAALTAWDHLSGSPPWSEFQDLHGCDVEYPTGGRRYPTRIARMYLRSGTDRGDVRVDRGLASGKWYRLRLQVFPDGTCGVALGDRPLWRSQSSLPLDRPYRLFLDGNSLNTRILVGPVEVWQGVRDDVDWMALDPEAGGR